MPRPDSLRRIGIVGQTLNPEVERTAGMLAELARRYDLELCPEPPLRDLFADACEFGAEDIDLLVTLGGDGTLLRGARLVATQHTPVLGVNLGHLGFLTSVRPPDLDRAFHALSSGDYWLDIRFTLEARVLCADGTESARYMALNDAVLHKGGFARVIRITVYVGDEREEVGEYTADGIILATPTGSTAYSLSAGGAIVAPSMECILATPISPHTLAVRPLVLPANTRIEVEVRQPSTEVVLTVDGQEGEALVTGDRLVVHRGEATVPLVRMEGQSFFSTLRRKLHWGAGTSERSGPGRPDDDRDSHDRDD